MNFDKFATSFAAVQMYLARAKSVDWLRELSIKQASEELETMFGELPAMLQAKVMSVAAQFKPQSDQASAPHVTFDITVRLSE